MRQLRKLSEIRRNIMGTLDQHQVKITVATLFVVMLFIIGASVQFGTWKTEMMSAHHDFNSRIATVDTTVTELKSEIKTLDSRANKGDVELAKINTKLSSIETLLIEIKSDLRSHSGD
jgi:cell division protein FtsL